MTILLSNNLLTTVDDLGSSEPFVKIVDVSGNPLVCDERLAWVKDPDAVRISYMQDDLVCAGPPALAGRLLGNLTRQDILAQQGDDIRINTYIHIVNICARIVQIS